MNRVGRGRKSIASVEISLISYTVPELLLLPVYNIFIGRHCYFRLSADVVYADHFRLRGHGRVRSVSLRRCRKEALCGAVGGMGREGDGEEYKGDSE